MAQVLMPNTCPKCKRFDQGVMSIISAPPGEGGGGMKQVDTSKKKLCNAHLRENGEPGLCILHVDCGNFERHECDKCYEVYSR